MAIQAIHIGTSGWTYDDWQGAFYPSTVKGAERLHYYASRFDTVEVNATFYRLPNAAMIQAWNRGLPDTFHLVVKGSRRVTHFRRLKDCAEPLSTFLNRVAGLRTLRVVLWQLPPSVHKDLPLLERFLGQLPGTFRYAIEFRHPSWWDEEVAALLSRHKAVFVTVSHPRLPGTIIPTTDVLYLRFHGQGARLYDYHYTERELVDWADRLRPHLAGRSVYAFFNNDHRAYAPHNALALRAILEAG